MPTRVGVTDNGAASYYGAVAVTPNDGADLALKPTRGLYIGGAGAVVVDMHGLDSSITFAAVPVGTILPIRVNRVRATGTAATNIVALY